jgi:hypothetical protein
MYEDTVQRIQAKFEAARRRIEAKFELVINTIDSFMAMVIAVIVGIVSVVTAVIKKTVTVFLYLLLVAFVFVPLVLAIALGSCIPGFWGMVLTILSVGMVIAAVAVVWFALASKPEGHANAETRANSWQRPVFSVGLVMNMIVLLLYVIYFQYPTVNENWLVAWLHERYSAFIALFHGATALG